MTYIATAEPGDTEMRRRIEEHRRRRPGSWRTVEAPLDLPGAATAALAGGGTVLVDCLTVYLSNLLLRDEQLDLEAASAAAERETGRLAALCSQDGAVADGSRLIIVSNEVGMGIVPDTELGRIFRDAAGRANQQLAAAAEAVYLCVSGISVRIK